jgi:transcription factor STE12
VSDCPGLLDNLTETSDLMNPYLPTFDSSLDTGAATRSPSSNSGSSPSLLNDHPNTHLTQAPDRRVTSSIALTSGGPSSMYSHRSSQRTTASFQSHQPRITDRGQSAFVPRFNPSATGLSGCKNLTRPLNVQEQENLIHLDKLKYFLATAPSRWSSTASGLSQNDSFPMDSSGHAASSHPSMNRFLLPSSEYITCVSWNNRYHITGTDIVRALVFRFEAFGRPVKNMKKFEEGIFSDLRNLKPGIDACLEEPKVSIVQNLSYSISRTPVTISGSSFQISVHTHSEKAKGVLLVCIFHVVLKFVAHFPRKVFGPS